MCLSELMQETGRIVDIFSREIDCHEGFMELSPQFASLRGTVVLLSDTGHDCSEYSILAALPWLELSSKGKNIRLQTEKSSLSFQGDVLETLRELSRMYCLDGLCYNHPVLSGLFGYLSYDLKDQIEDLPRTCVDDLKLPDICMFAPSLLLIQDNRSPSRTIHIPVFYKNSVRSDPHKQLQKFYKIRKDSHPRNLSSDPEKNVHFRSNFQRGEYIETVQKIREYIRSGEIYQINLSQRFNLDFQYDPFALLCDLFNENPAPFFAYINAGSHQVLSTSPERFLCRRGNSVETRPIKGTRPRGANPEQDQKYARELLNSPKDDAELSMIVDLLRNDLGKCCKYNTVKVSEHKRLEKYHNVHHLVSIVRGELAPGFENTDLIRAAFPGGSITGCPKVRAMEIIDELEPHARHVYTGSIGYLGFQGNMDLSIAIRTATVHAGKIFFSVGGGIVWDSKPDKEYEETLHKGRTLMRYFSGKIGQGEVQDKKVWLNGKIQSRDQAQVSPLSPGIQYGCGFFETLRCDRGKVQYLTRHLERFHRAWRDIFLQEPPNIHWEDVITTLIRKNKLQDTVAVVKILAALGEQQTPPEENLLLVSADEYQSRLDQRVVPALSLKTYPEPRQTPWADYKTMSRLFYYQAGYWAKKKAGDEALILNPDGSISETNSGNLLLLSGENVILPVSKHILSGVMMDSCLEVLRYRGFKIEQRTVYPGEATEADLLLMTNSLLGAVNIGWLDDCPLPLDPEFCNDLNSELL